MPPFYFSHVLNPDIAMNNVKGINQAKNPLKFHFQFDLLNSLLSLFRADDIMWGGCEGCLLWNQNIWCRSVHNPSYVVGTPRLGGWKMIMWLQRRVANPVANGSAGLMTHVTFVIFILRQEVVPQRIHCFPSLPPEVS